MRENQAMKKIEAIIQPHKLEDVKEALKGIGIDGMTIYRSTRPRAPEGPQGSLSRHGIPGGSAAQGQDRDGGSRRALFDEVIQTLVASARTGKIGDGKVFVYDVAEAIRIRNDDRGDGAL